MPTRALPLISFCFLGIGIAYVIGSLDLPMGTSDRPGAGLYPFLVGILSVTISLLLFIGSLRQKETPEEAEEEFPRGRDLRRVVSVGLTLVFFALLLKPVGFGICSALLMGTILRLLGLRDWKKIILISILSAALSYYLFARLLYVPLPKGIFLS